MSDECPRHAIHPWKTSQWFIQQHRQRAEVAARQPFVNFLKLRLDQMKVIQQPFCGGTDVVASGRLHADVAMGFAQRGNVALQSWKESGRASRGTSCAVRIAQASAVLRESLGAKKLGTDRRF